MSTASAQGGFSSLLLRWFAENRRDLPWRDTQDPYAIWLSEVILQQTRIEQGRPYWERFMARWPRVEDLAKASEDEVLRMWQGLGYYSRARNLHAAARQIVAAGTFPTTLEGIRALKGVGDYTAAAIGSIAFGLPAAVVDGNVYRVLARHFGIEVPINTTEGKRLFASLAQSLLPEDAPSAFNQAMMDFGAIQCTPQSPRCLLCPFQETCVALREGWVGRLPVKLRKVKISTRRLVYVYVRWNGQTAFRKRGKGDIWEGLWEPYVEEAAPGGLAAEGAPGRPLLPAALPAGGGRLELLRQGVRHVLTHRVLLADFYLLEACERPALPEGYVWMPEPDVEHCAKPRLVELLLEALPR